MKKRWRLYMGAAVLAAGAVLLAAGQKPAWTHGVHANPNSPVENLALVNQTSKDTHKTEWKCISRKCKDGTSPISRGAPGWVTCPGDNCHGEKPGDGSWEYVTHYDLFEITWACSSGTPATEKSEVWGPSYPVNGPNPARPADVVYDQRPDCTQPTTTTSSTTTTPLPPPGQPTTTTTTTQPPAPGLTVGDATAVEGHNAVFTIRLTGTSGRVSWWLTGGTRPGQATIGTDFEAFGADAITVRSLQTENNIRCVSAP